MSTISAEEDFTLQCDGDNSCPSDEYLSKPSFDSLFATDERGECVTEEGLDWLWPTDDREPVEFTGKGFKMPHTCVEMVPCHEKYGDEVCLKFAFGGSDLAQTTLPAVPLPPTGILLASVLLSAMVLKKMKALK